MTDSIWTLKPETTRVDLVWRTRSAPSDGEAGDEGERWDEHPFWIDLKRELTIGEQKKIDNSGFHSMSRRRAADAEDDVEVNIDWSAVNVHKVKTWIAAWSLQDDKGRSLKIATATIEQFPTDLFELIESEVDRHAKAVVEDRKNSLTTSAT